MVYTPVSPNMPRAAPIRKLRYQKVIWSTNLVQTVHENESYYLKAQIHQAKQAKELYHTLGMPSMQDFKAIIQMNTIMNNPVTVKDINLCDQIYGPDIATPKGKTV